MKGTVALIIIFNHRFDKNIDVLRKLYEPRFSNLFFLVPFYNGNKPNVIPVYESSFYFQGYMAQGYSRFFSESFEHYFFLADDMVLNPAINETNYRDYFGLTPGACFIPEIFTLDHFSNNDTLLFSPYYSLMDRLLRRGTMKPSKNLWWRIRQAFAYDPKVEGVEAAREIPTAEEALELIKRHGYQVKPLAYIDLFGGCPVPRNFTQFRQLIRYVIRQKVRKTRYPLKYPLVASYSDIVIVSREAIARFIQYCGVFAATELFVEYAVPTALCLAAPKVVTEPQLAKRGLIYWVYSDAQKDRYEKDMGRFNYSLKTLVEQFPGDSLYIHPIKLSKWKTENI